MGRDSLSWIQGLFLSLSVGTTSWLGIAFTPRTQRRTASSPSSPGFCSETPGLWALLLRSGHTTACPSNLSVTAHAGL